MRRDQRTGSRAHLRPQTERQQKEYARTARPDRQSIAIHPKSARSGVAVVRSSRQTADADPARSLRRRPESDSGRRDAGNPYSGSRILQQTDSQTESTARFYFGQYFGQTVPNVVQRNRKGDRRRRRSGDRPRVGRSSHRKSIVDRQGRRERRN